MSSLEIGRCCLLQQWSRLGGPPGPGRSPLVKKTWKLRIWLRKRLVDGGDFNIFNHVMVDGGTWLQHCLSCYDLPESVPLPGSPPWRLSDLGLRKCWGKPHPPGISSMRNLMGIPDEHQLKLSPQAVQPGPKASKGSGSMAHRGSYGSSHWIAMKMSWEVSVSEMSTHILCVWMNASSTGCTALWRWHHLGLIKWRYIIYMGVWMYHGFLSLVLDRVFNLTKLWFHAQICCSCYTMNCCGVVFTTALEGQWRHSSRAATVKGQAMVSSNQM